MTPTQTRKRNPLIDDNPRATEYHAGRIAHAPVAFALVPVAFALVPLLFVCGLAREYGETFAEVLDPTPNRIREAEDVPRA